MDSLRALLRLLVGLQLFFIALYLDGHWGLERQAVHVIPAFVYVACFALYFAFMLMRMYRSTSTNNAVREEKGIASLRRAERIVRPILYTAVAIEFIVYWPQDWCRASDDVLGGCWGDNDYVWWLLAVQAALPDLLVFLALLPKGIDSLQNLNAMVAARPTETYIHAGAKAASVPLLQKVHLY